MAEARKLKRTDNLKGTYYGSREISSILASFESQIIRLSQYKGYVEGSKARAKHQDRIRLEAAQGVLDLLEKHHCHSCEGMGYRCDDENYSESDLGQILKENLAVLNRAYGDPNQIKQQEA